MNDADAVRLVDQCIAILRPIAERHPSCGTAQHGLDLMDRIEAELPRPHQHWLYDDEVVLSAEAVRLIWRGVEQANSEAEWHCGTKKGKQVAAICKRLRMFLDQCRAMPEPSL